MIGFKLKSTTVLIVFLAGIVAVFAIASNKNTSPFNNLKLSQKNQHEPSILAASTASLSKAQSSAPKRELALESKAKEFDHLTKSSSPKDYFQAYMLAQACIWSRESQRDAEMTPQANRDADTQRQLDSGALELQSKTACGDLSDEQLAQRQSYLAKAAEAGVPMAALRLSAEGPFGDPSALITRPDDPAVLEWRKHVVELLKLATTKGDISAMESLSNMYFSGTGVVEGRDPAKALQYQTAMWEAWKNSTGKISPFAERRINELSTGLTPEQVEAAKQAGQLLAMRIQK